MIGTFECRFKQCDESFLNEARVFQQYFVRQRNQAMKLGNLGRVDYLLGLADVAGARRQ